MKNDLRIFLSSTKVDLAETRQSILRFLEVLRSDLISMEVFGSDETRPKEFCLRQVERCNFFIGLYAERYGAIDSESGLSITELEYDKAYQMLQAGRLLGLLVYVVDPKANWPINRVDREEKQVAKLKALRKKLTERHTISCFKSTEELPFLVLRDVIRKIGVGTKDVLQPKAVYGKGRRKALQRPIGMEYYTEELTAFFSGREDGTKRMADQVMSHRMSLLIGASGIGKTSLVNAGLFPRLSQLGWRCAVIRPLTRPMDNLRRSLWDALMEGVPPKQFDFSAVVRSVAMAHEPNPVLIVVDQFEDILGAEASRDVEPLTRALFDIYRRGEGNVRLVMSYRGDVESQIGSIWQKVSRSAEGLPRSYLGPLGERGCTEALKVNLNALGVALQKSPGARYKGLLERIVRDLASESLLAGYSGPYPPFLQMVVSRVCADADTNGNYTKEAYESSGECRGIIADFLISQLKYLGKKQEHGKQVLIALVSSYGTKTQKSVGEISAEVLLDESEVEKLVESLIDLRMVRAVNNDVEIVHDFLAKRIVAELVAAEERESKKFKELLASRAALYDKTGAGLTRAEHLHLYRHRHKILCTEQEVRLLVASHLAGNGPIHFWLRQHPKDKILAWVRSFLRSEDPEVVLNSYRFMIKSGQKMPLEEVAEHFSDYKMKDELGGFILTLASLEDVTLLLHLSRKKAEEVAEASREALLKLFSISDHDFLQLLARSNSHKSSRLFEALSLRFARGLKLRDIRTMWVSAEQWKKLLSLYALGEMGRERDQQWLELLLKTPKLAKRYQVAAVKSITRLACRFRRPETIRSLLKRSQLVVKATLESLEKPLPGLKPEELLPYYGKFPFETAKALRGVATRQHLPFLKRTLKAVRLGPAARDLLLAICDNGGEKEFDFLLQVFLNCPHRIEFWNPVRVFRAVASLASQKHASTLEDLMQLNEFWEYYPRAKRPSPKIPAVEFDNIYLVKRLVGVSYAHIARRRHLSKLVKLLRHQYWIIWNPAAEALIDMARPEDLPQFVEQALSSPADDYGIVKVLCGVDAQVYS